MQPQLTEEEILPLWGDMRAWFSGDSGEQSAHNKKDGLESGRLPEQLFRQTSESDRPQSWMSRDQPTTLTLMND